MVACWFTCMKRSLNMACLTFAAIVLAAMGAPVAPPAASSVQVVALRTEYQQNPLGIDALKPRLSCCYLNTITMIDQLGQFISEQIEAKSKSLFGGPRFPTLAGNRELAIDIAPFLRGRVSAKRRLIGHFSEAEDVLRFVNSQTPNAWPT